MIVFRRGTDIWRMAPDGSGQVRLTGGERRYEWPSAADDGTIVASDETGRLQRMSRDGVALGEPIPTAATVATGDVAAETPTHVRVSPDGTRIAYDEVIEGDPTTLWARGLKRTVTRKLANAGTTTIRLRLPKKIARSARRLVLAVRAPGAARVTATIRPRT
jgi:hypothetical protein